MISGTDCLCHEDCNNMLKEVDGWVVLCNHESLQYEHYFIS